MKNQWYKNSQSILWYMKWNMTWKVKTSSIQKPSHTIDMKTKTVKSIQNQLTRSMTGYESAGMGCKHSLIILCQIWPARSFGLINKGGRPRRSQFRIQKLRGVQKGPPSHTRDQSCPYNLHDPAMVLYHIHHVSLN